MTLPESTVVLHWEKGLLSCCTGKRVYCRVALGKGLRRGGRERKRERERERESIRRWAGRGDTHSCMSSYLWPNSCSAVRSVHLHRLQNHVGCSQCTLLVRWHAPPPLLVLWQGCRQYCTKAGHHHGTEAGQYQGACCMCSHVQGVASCCGVCEHILPSCRHCKPHWHRCR